MTNPNNPTETEPVPEETSSAFETDGSPTLEALEKELEKEKYRRGFGQVLRSTIFTLIVAAAAAALLSVMAFPVLQIIGDSMTPTLEDGDIVIAIKGTDYETGDVVAFYYNNNILVKRVIAVPGQWVDIDAEGNVTVDGEPLDEPYIDEPALGDCDITLPYQVPDGKLFVMGDHRATSVDSRNTVVGCIGTDLLIGKLSFQVWPLEDLGLVR